MTTCVFISGLRSDLIGNCLPNFTLDVKTNSEKIRKYKLLVFDVNIALNINKKAASIAY